MYLLSLCFLQALSAFTLLGYRDSDVPEQFAQPVLERIQELRHPHPMTMSLRSISDVTVAAGMRWGSSPPHAAPQPSAPPTPSHTLAGQLCTHGTPVSVPPAATSMVLISPITAAGCVVTPGSLKRPRDEDMSPEFFIASEVTLIVEASARAADLLIELEAMCAQLEADADNVATGVSKAP